MIQTTLQVLAALLSPGDIGYDPAIKDASSSTIANVMNPVYMIAGMVAVLTIVIAGFIFITSNGDAGKVAKAKMAIFASVVGLIIIMFAFVITQFVIGKVAG